MDSVGRYLRSNIDLSDLQQQRSELDARFAALTEEGLRLDMTRGKPAPEQLDLSQGLLTVLSPEDYRAQDGTDCRNYGGLKGLPEALALMAGLLDARPEQVLVGGNSSLTLMHDTFARAMSHGVPDGSGPWSSSLPKFLCPVPGYDRHFSICQHFGVEMINVDLGDGGLDIETVERLVAHDANIKGIWLVPKYSNPTGVSLSSAIVQRLAKMKTAAPDFRIFWDNAYSVHHLGAGLDEVDSILEACDRAGHPNRPFAFASTSKITFAGAGLSAFAASADNLVWLEKHLSMSTIGPDKINQLRHVRFFGDFARMRAHMDQHAAILKPKFDAVERILSHELGGLGVASWTQPKGGYFVSVDTLDGCANAVVEAAARAGVKLTKAGATFPYGKDPRDRNIRVAPSLPSLAEIEKAMEVFCVCIKRASLERYG